MGGVVFLIIYLFCTFLHIMHILDVYVKVKVTQVSLYHMFEKAVKGLMQLYISNGENDTRHNPTKTSIMQ